MASGKGSGILARLADLEASQSAMLSDMTKRHESERDELRARLAAAKERRRSAEVSGGGGTGDVNLPAPVLMELDMREIDAAVAAASTAEMESKTAMQEAVDAAERAKGGGGQLVVAGADGVPGVGGTGSASDADVGFGADSEFIVKQVNVNLDDVERVINGSPLVEVCRAFGRPDKKFGNEVYCCVVPKRNVRVSEPMLLLYAQKYLSSALCPKRFFFLESLPTGITRKQLAGTRMGEIGTHSPNGLEAPPPAP